ncbi:MAG: GNAT family N-acetyltransferase [Actinomycetota bacterium]|nr:GNAT family N-acetyltransferase [Actinomycetota bacterium]
MAAVATIELRRVVPDDGAFLRAVYGSTRWDELEPTGWTDEQKHAFLDHQFEAQDVYYRENYEGATYDVIVIDGFPAGRLYVARWPEQIRIMDIALLPAARGKGVGTTLLRELQDEAAAEGKRLTIHVEHENPALRLYERLGFRRVEDRIPYVLMEWPPRPM